MNTYVDASVLMRVVLHEPNRLRTWHRIETPVSSELITIECLRTVDRARIQFGLSDQDVADQRAACLAALDSVDMVPLERAVLTRAAEPFPTKVGTLDAIHLATALLVRDQLEGLAVATHDAELGRAARAVGFEVLGI